MLVYLEYILFCKKLTLNNFSIILFQQHGKLVEKPLAALSCTLASTRGQLPQQSSLLLAREASIRHLIGFTEFGRVIVIGMGNIDKTVVTHSRIQHTTEGKEENYSEAFTGK